MVLIAGSVCPESLMCCGKDQVAQIVGITVVTTGYLETRAGAGEA